MIPLCFAALAAAAGAGDCPVRFTDVAAQAGTRFTHDRGVDARAPPAGDDGRRDWRGWTTTTTAGWTSTSSRAGRFPPAAAPHAADRLYRNNGDGTFTDVTAQGRAERHARTGWARSPPTTTTTASWTCYVTNYGGDILYRNDGNGTFTDVTAKAGLAAARASARPRRGRTSTATAISISSSTQLRRRPQGQDALLRRSVRRARATTARRSCTPARSALLYRNDGDGTFTRHHAGGRPRQGRRQGRSASSSSTSTSTASPTSTSPTTRS